MVSMEDRGMLKSSESSGRFSVATEKMSII